MEIDVFSFEFQLNLLKMSKWQWSIIGSHNGLLPNSRQPIIWTNDGLDYWGIYASVGLNELNMRTKSDELQRGSPNIFRLIQNH